MDLSLAFKLLSACVSSTTFFFFFEAVRPHYSSGRFRRPRQCARNADSIAAAEAQAPSKDCSS